ncbi:CNP1-like family protein [Variovorax sp. HJSM1_2]|uniref:CNP1-like family protein n=1 Tax=Variovorax sp. HJSM1_2 TaxID=3366263 RepID=UPI003BC67299
MPRLSLQRQKLGGKMGYSGKRAIWNTASLIGLTALLTAAAAVAQVTPAEDPDWKESEVPPPPAFDAKKLIRIDMDRVVELRYGVDPASITINNEGVTRYVMTTTNAEGMVAAMYEGLRCATGEVKVYGRYNEGKWRATPNPEWRTLFGNPAVRHSLAFARQGACSGTAPPNTVADLVRNLKSPRSDLPR